MGFLLGNVVENRGNRTGNICVCLNAKGNAEIVLAMLGELLL